MIHQGPERISTQCQINVMGKTRVFLLEVWLNAVVLNTLPQIIQHLSIERVSFCLYLGILYAVLFNAVLYLAHQNTFQNSIDKKYLYKSSTYSDDIFN